ncbi:response regulator [Sneathiella sp.]|uniref:response regulator n=1 Tax=Sneathiella sp. TaxID=1964365 RepID=UPI00356A8BAB
MRLLIVEDDIMIGETLQRALRKSGYAVDWLQDGRDVELSLQNSDYALLILDLGLPGRNGFSILTDLRMNGNDIPVLILTARNAIADKVSGLDMGADDYMLKPFALEELEARIRLLLRRKNGQKTTIQNLGGLSIDAASHKVSLKNQAYTFSSKEFALLTILMERPGVIFSRAQLEEKLYGWNEEVASNAIEVHIHQIRKKLGKDIIKNIRNVGYTLAEDPEIN